MAYSYGMLLCIRWITRQWCLGGSCKTTRAGSQTLSLKLALCWLCCQKRVQLDMIVVPMCTLLICVIYCSNLLYPLTVSNTSFKSLVDAILPGVYVDAKFWCFNRNGIQSVGTGYFRTNMSCTLATLLASLCLFPTVLLKICWSAAPCILQQCLSAT